ncbi:MipA/OmpV family protein [Roseateles sp. DAIF2]|uniref:MipA/OmpV family protein n=1 Tax=Roseateles sp. DAIF2 TaxID=2714952 RepID=UPI0018A2E952|nr:MipA/OmpV family protein [Roseateles sp. DAIF2]QPF71820.1 MipA/OmpV family protein [Roseateles sp. DAIF2]
MMMKSRIAWFCVLCLMGLGARADPEPAAAEPEHKGARYLLGAALSVEPEYAGADRQRFKLRPLWAMQYGRFRLSTSRASGLMSLGGGEAGGPGASLDLLRGERLRLGLSLRVDRGRDSDESAHLAGVPDVRGTLRGRVYASYVLAGPWSLAGGLSQDLLGRKGGLLGSLDLNYRGRLGPGTEWGAGAGLSFGDRRYMRSYFGISEAVAARSVYAVFDPERATRDLHAGIGLSRVLDRHWVGFVGAGISTLLADAAASPLTQRRYSYSAAAGLAYRWGP